VCISLILGYARVSTDGQTLEGQVSGRRAAGAERIFAEKQSGAKTDRAALAKALAALGAVTKLEYPAHAVINFLAPLYFELAMTLINPQSSD
jgi:hypothetical protein